MSRVTIIDYKVGNLRSVQKAFESFGVTAEITDDPRSLAVADKIILPGVGAFGSGIEKLRQSGFEQALAEHQAKGKPLLGICLGMQLLFAESEEMGVHTGLGFVKGKVLRFSASEHLSLKVPHMGWNTVSFRKPSAFIKGLDDESYFYFVHSYYCQPETENITLGETTYGKPFCSMLQHENLFGVQFHPEKSSTVGLRLLENFAKL
jgi:glutamine amidotransferase